MKKNKLSVIALRDVKDKTVAVEILSRRKHALYSKTYLQTKKLLVHSELDIKKGNRLLIEETRPKSRRKAWQVVDMENK